jgi:acetoin utilization protein AcuB
MDRALHRNTGSAKEGEGATRQGVAGEAMLIENWMKTLVRTVKPRASVAHARAILEEYRINQLPVVVNDKLVGIVTDRDLREAPQAVRVGAAAEGRAEPAAESDDILVETVMTAALRTLSPTDTLERAARLMRQERIGALPIVEKCRLVGILTRSDILDAFVAVVKPRLA